MPIKLTISFLIIVLMVPTVMSSVDNIHRTIDDTTMTDAGYELRSVLSKVNGRGPNFVMQTEFNIPDGGYLVIGEGSGRSISVYWEDRHVKDILLDFRIQSRMVLEGDVLLRLSNGEDGVVVKEL